MRKIIEKISRFNDNDLKERFIEYFGEDKWHEEEVLTDIQKLVFDICDKWLGVEPIPVLFGEHIRTDEAIFDIKEKVIWLNPKNVDNMVELMAATIHELEHYYQLLYISNFDTPKANRWKFEMDNYIGGEDPLRNLIQEIEIDANAFAQIVLKTDYGIHYEHTDPIIQELINRYTISKKMLSDD